LARKRLHRVRARHLIAATAVALILTLASTLAVEAVYLRPQVDVPRRADAVLILGGPDHERYPFGLALGREGFASTVVVSNPDGPRNRWLTNECENPPPGIVVHCFNPDPSTTKGEGRELRRLASEHGWKTVIVVTIRPHISRARYVLQSCFAGDLVMVPSPTNLSLAEWAYQYLYQTGGYARAVLEPGC